MGHSRPGRAGSKSGQCFGGQCCPDYARAYFAERRISRARHIIAERRKSAVIGSSQALKRDVFRSFKNALSDFFRRLYARIDRINYPNENALLILAYSQIIFEYSWSVAFARQLYVKISCLQLEEAGRESGIVHFRRGLRHVAGHVHPNSLSLFGRKSLQRQVVEVDKAFQEAQRWIQFD